MITLALVGIFFFGGGCGKSGYANHYYGYQACHWHCQQRCVGGPVLVSPYHPVYHGPKEKSLYERLGGEGAIKAVVDDLAARAAANPKVNFTRKGTPAEWKPTPENIERLKKMLVDLIGESTGGPQKYTGKSLKEAHRGMQITQAEFDALAADFKATLDKFKVPAKEQDELLKIVGSTAGDIVEKK